VVPNLIRPANQTVAGIFFTTLHVTLSVLLDEIHMMSVITSGLQQEKQNDLKKPDFPSYNLVLKIFLFIYPSITPSLGCEAT